MIKLCSIIFTVACINNTPFEIRDVNFYESTKETPEQFVIKVREIDCKTNKMYINEQWVLKKACINIKMKK